MMFIFKNKVEKVYTRASVVVLKVRIIPYRKVQEKSNELSQESQIMQFKVVQGHEQQIMELL